jgi:hypothetical protein
VDGALAVGFMLGVLAGLGAGAVMFALGYVLLAVRAPGGT